MTRAIVTPIAGTTRDLLRERLEVEGVPLQVLRHRGPARRGDAVEGRACAAPAPEMARADRVLFVVDAPADPGGAG